MYRLTVRTSIPNTNGTICEFLQSQLWSVPYPWPSSYFPEFSFWLVPDFRSSENLEIFSNLKNRLIIDPVVGPLSELNVQFLLNAAFWTLIYILTLLPASNQRYHPTLLFSPSNPSRDSFTLLHRFTNLEQMEPMSFVIYYQIYSFYNKCVSKL